MNTLQHLFGAITAPERMALRQIVAEADVIQTPHGPVLVAPITDDTLRILEGFESASEDLEFEEDIDDEDRCEAA